MCVSGCPDLERSALFVLTLGYLFSQYNLTAFKGCEAQERCFKRQDFATNNLRSVFARTRSKRAFKPPTVRSAGMCCRWRTADLFLVRSELLPRVS